MRWWPRVSGTFCHFWSNFKKRIWKLRDYLVFGKILNLLWHCFSVTVQNGHRRKCPKIEKTFHPVTLLRIYTTIMDTIEIIFLRMRVPVILLIISGILISGSNSSAIVSDCFCLCKNGSKCQQDIILKSTGLLKCCKCIPFPVENNYKFIKLSRYAQGGKLLHDH